MQTLNVTIGGMHCGACVRRVTQQLQQTPGLQVQEVSVGSARVAYDPKLTSPQAIIGAIERIGFQPTLSQESPS